MQTHYIK